MSTEPTPPILDELKKRLLRGESFLQGAHIPRGDFSMWISLIRRHLFQLYGKDAAEVDYLIPNVSYKTLPDDDAAVRTIAQDIARRLRSLISQFEELARRSEGEERIFIGHGRSETWLRLDKFLRERLHLLPDEFNQEAVAGMTTFARLEEMLSNARFAFLVMTAEDEHADETLHARENVVHELGLFQGRLGSKRAIILKEEGCAEFSNIVGLAQIRFPKGEIKACFEEIRQLLEDRGVIESIKPPA